MAHVMEKGSYSVFLNFFWLEGLWYDSVKRVENLPCYMTDSYRMGKPTIIGPRKDVMS